MNLKMSDNDDVLNDIEIDVHGIKNVKIKDASESKQ